MLYCVCADVEEAGNCLCHTKDVENHKNQNKAIKKILIAIVLGTIFLLVEAVGEWSMYCEHYYAKGGKKKKKKKKKI